MTDLFPKAAIDYWTDAWQRTILTWDILRERGNQYIEHEKSGKPPVLAFDYEMVMDGGQRVRPANYALARIEPPAGAPPTDAAKRPCTRSSIGVSSYEYKEHDLPSAKLRQRYLLASVRLRREIGSDISLCDHRCLLVTCG